MDQKGSLNRIKKKYIKLNENEDRTQQNLWDIVKVILTGKFIALNAYIKQAGKSQMVIEAPLQKQKKKRKIKPGQAEGRG